MPEAAPPPWTEPRAARRGWTRALALPLAALLLMLSSGLAPPNSALTPQAWAQPRRKPKPLVKVEVLSLTDGAEIYIDGELVGTVPLAAPLEVEPGEHVVKVTKRGYVDYYETHTIKASKKPYTIEADLLPFSGIISISTQPSGAQVLFDGNLVGETPFEGEIDGGVRRITILAPGHKAHEESREIIAGNQYYLDVTLETEPIPIEEPPFYTTWWFWTGVAVVLAGGTVAAFAFTGGEEPPVISEPVDGTVRLGLGVRF